MKKIYEIHEAVTETWVFEIEAESEEEAMQIFNSPGGKDFQTHSLAGGNSDKPAFIKRVREI